MIKKGSKATAAPYEPVEEAVVPPPPGMEPAVPSEPAKPVVLLPGEEEKPEAEAPPPAPEAKEPAAAEPAEAAAEELAPPVAAEPEKSADGPDARIVFKTTETAVPLSIKPELDAIASRLKEDDRLRVSLVAYASTSGDQATTARRVSLSRALSVRAYLIDQGIASLRINVQAEGDKGKETGESDRVDIFVKKSE